jgi:hypothetical protein
MFFEQDFIRIFFAKAANVTHMKARHCDIRFENLYFITYEYKKDNINYFKFLFIYLKANYDNYVDLVISV